MDALWASPLVSNVLFQARTCLQPPGPNAGVVEVSKAVSLAYVLYGDRAVRSGPVVVVFHGNAETVLDVGGGTAQLLLEAGAGAVLAIDLRGYAWSTGGSPSIAALRSDSAALASALPDMLAGVGLSHLPLMLYGRSLGATAAVHLAAAYTPVREPILSFLLRTSATLTSRRRAAWPGSFSRAG